MADDLEVFRPTLTFSTKDEEITMRDLSNAIT